VPCVRRHVSRYAGIESTIKAGDAGRHSEKMLLWYEDGSAKDIHSEICRQVLRTGLLPRVRYFRNMVEKLEKTEYPMALELLGVYHRAVIDVSDITRRRIADLMLEDDKLEELVQLVAGWSTSGMRPDDIIIDKLFDAIPKVDSEPHRVLLYIPLFRLLFREQEWNSPRVFSRMLSASMQPECEARKTFSILITAFRRQVSLEGDQIIAAVRSLLDRHQTNEIALAKQVITIVSRLSPDIYEKHRLQFVELEEAIENSLQKSSSASLAPN